MAALQQQYDEAMLQFSMGHFDDAVGRLQSILTQAPAYFEARLALGMAYYRKGDYAAAITEGHKAEKLRPTEQLVHTNLSLFYMKAGKIAQAEHHGLQARIASWRDQAKQDKSGAPSAPDPELELARPKPKAVKLPGKFPDMPWKKK